ncbi:MAG: SMC-Scp complex subunit ScpB [Coriobacteriia bacterium]|nr:SMC-Scp complex subunit ScpB [Coriobacteriia bacterium]
MFNDLTEAQLEGAIEALLFVSDEPVNVLTLCEMLEAQPVQVQDALTRLSLRLNAGEGGVQLQEMAGGWRLCTNPAYHEIVEQYVLSWDTRRLTQAALETLAIVAYGQPITKLGISSIRGVNSDSSVNTLMEKGLIRESGPADAPGYPMTYSTTKGFLERFGLKDTDDLPDIERFAPDEETATLLREGLSAHARFGLLDEEPPLAPMLPGLEDLSDASGEGVVDLSRSMRDAINAAMASSAGVVEKIDFSELEFEE